ncbi:MULTISPECIES: hypothetical protein [unclassified Ensifer]|uniref:hypothetical protein n=1 Tax=unclassified Ensifer TaxID=2633371 RepID=UPI0008130A0C|nr:MULTISPECIES: hypothetical protein [unclassified Ensifer]OCP21934.1 hypothetical protein BC361_25535 [Ensifer sp. LC54]OCP23286.1 hypothetical protein BC363_25230 [Ensifer sp. LC384]
MLVTNYQLPPEVAARIIRIDAEIHRIVYSRDQLLARDGAPSPEMSSLIEYYTDRIGELLTEKDNALEILDPDLL